MNTSLRSYWASTGKKVEFCMSLVRLESEAGQTASAIHVRRRTKEEGEVEIVYYYPGTSQAKYCWSVVRDCTTEGKPYPRSLQWDKPEWADEDELIKYVYDNTLKFEF